MEPNENYFDYSLMRGQIPIQIPILPLHPMTFQQPQQPLSTNEALQRVNEVVCDLRNKYVVKNRSQFDVYDLNDIITLTYYIGTLTVNMVDILQHIKEILDDYGNQFMLKTAAESYRRSCEYAKDTTRFL